MSNRQSWDEFYLGLSEYMATRSRDPSTKVGAVIVRPDKSVASVGFNGFPQKMSDNETLYANRDEKYSRIIHGEVNALNFCNESVKGYTLFTTPFMPCDRCFVVMAQAGITRFVFPRATEEQLTRWGAAFDKVRGYAADMGLELVEIER
jgi:dCMP deaminase